MINTLLLPELREMLAADDRAGLEDFCAAMHPARAAEFMQGLTPAETWAVLQAAEPAERVEIFEYLDEARQVEILETAAPEETSQVIANMAPDDRVDLLKLVDPAAVERLLPLVPTEERRDINRLSLYPEGTAGSLMTTNVARLSESVTVGDALKEIALQTQNHETIYYIYVVDGENHLRGLITARQLLMHLGTPDELVTDLMQRDLVTVEATDDQEAVASKVADYNFMAIPVVDHEHHLVGIITHDDVIDVLREEAEEDAYRAGAIAPLEESYLSTPIHTLSWKRGMWLSALLAASFLTVFALKSFNKTLDAVGWLALFLPLIVSCGGNSGGQSATLVITALTSGDLTIKDWWRVLRRELSMGLLLGAWLGSIAYVGALLVVDEPTAGELLVIPITLLLVVTCSTIVGGALPLIFRRLGLDPALMSNPFVAGIIDITGILIYLTVCITLLEGI
ncbi:magnesium transporter [Lacipirellula limnantheis]|uniref:Magnesium transporter MgtE n=1 Tax=Lacipirellula limnantheis TaxID=2528024 RepID=A0A517TZE1_9BACT|nr:magnesium transporter [Lacipirellula limnantheis]QDT73734.1 Magnesium transporter MgtE [Lacipirellula limnantheis]